MPTERADDVAFPHPARLPLGAAWRGVCQATGSAHYSPGLQELECCNLGYAKACPRLPVVRSCDAVRFAIVSESGPRISVQYAFEADHLPAGNGLLEYDRESKSWLLSHPEARTQKLAECFLQSYLERKIPL